MENKKLMIILIVVFILLSIAAYGIFIHKNCDESYKEYTCYTYFEKLSGKYTPKTKAVCGNTPTGIC